MGDNDNVAKFFQDFRDLFPYLDISQHPVTGTLALILAPVIMVVLFNVLTRAVHSDDKGKKPRARTGWKS